MKTKILLFFMLLSCSIIYGQRDSLYMSKLRTYQPIDTTEIDRDVEYEVVLKHYSVDEGSVIRRDTVSGYAAEYVRQLIQDAERDSANLKSFLEVHYNNFLNTNTEYFNMKNYLTALRNVATGAPMGRQTPLEPAVEKQYIGRVINQAIYGLETYSTDSLIVGATYKIFNYASGDDFSNVGATNTDQEHFVATGKTPAVWTNGSQLRIDTISTSQTSGTLTIGKVYYLYDGIYGGDDFSNLIRLKYDKHYSTYTYLPSLPAFDYYYYINEQPTTWLDATPVISNYLPSIELKNDIGINVNYYYLNDYSIIIACDLPVFNNPNYNIDLSVLSISNFQFPLIPITDKVAIIGTYNFDSSIYDLTLKITKF